MPSLLDLLAKGFFPSELPPAFTTANFANAVVSAGALDPGFTIARPRSALLCVHNLVRSGGLRRNLGIPNPLQYSRLCEFVVRNWAQLQLEASRSPYSLTKPVDTKPERAISREHDLGERTSKRVELRSRARFVLRTDISRFYPSIYTHSLPWAIHSKAVVKTAKAAGTLNTLWSNDLDALARNLNDQQTLGLPIGPDCSLLLSEIVLGAVDQELGTKFPGLYGIRFIDDYEFAVDQRPDAERVHSILQLILSNYELALNASKTKIIQLPDFIEPLWTSKLRTFLFRATNGQLSDLTAYFDFVFASAKTEPDENIIKYGIARLNGVAITNSNWPILQNLLAQCARVEPACLPQVCDQIVYHKSNGLTIDTSLWDDCLNQIVVERLPLSQASEAVWAMWLMKQLGIQLTSAAEQAVDNCEDSPAALMGLALAHSGLGNPGSFTRLNSFAEPDELFGRQWLLCYEGVRQGWIRPPTGANTLASHGAFNFLDKRGVSFFNFAAPPKIPPRTALLTVEAGGGGGGFSP